MTNSNQRPIIFTDLPKQADQISPEIPRESSTLAIIGAQVLALKAWQNPGMNGADLNDQLDSIILDHDIDIEDTHEIRKMCHEVGVDTTTYGDDAPTLTFGHSPRIYADQIAQLFETRYNLARLASDPVRELEVTEQLIEKLATAAGIHIK